MWLCKRGNIAEGNHPSGSRFNHSFVRRLRFLQKRFWECQWPSSSLPFCTRRQCDQMIESKVAQFSTKVVPKVEQHILRKLWCFSKQVRKSSNIWVTFITKCETQNLSKIAQSGHIAHRETLSDRQTLQGSGCSSVGRAVASDIWDPRFESSHRRILSWTFVNLLSTIL